MKSPFRISVSIVFLLFVEHTIKVTSSPQLLLANNGPALLGANITFFAQLLDYDHGAYVTYVFNDGIQTLNYSTTSYNISVSATFPPEHYVQRRYCMNVSVEVEKFIVFKEKIAENVTCFELRRYLIGEIIVYQRNTTDGEGVDEVAVGENFTAVLKLHDPNHFLKDATIDFAWIIDMESHITIENSIIYNFTDAGEKSILTRATATFPDNTQVFGYFSKTVIAKVPVNSVNVTGNPFLYHGDFLLLNISCFGTPPFEYCSQIMEDNVTMEDFTCTQISVFTSCHMEIKKFLTDGTYHLGIYIANDVREYKKIMEVMVYDVDIKPTLSTVIIPIVCSLLTLIIIAIGISFYIQQRNQLAIEVANFDFVDESDSYVGERTFFEKIFDSFTCRNCEQNRWSCVSARSESDPLLDDQSLPYV